MIIIKIIEFLLKYSKETTIGYENPTVRPIKYWNNYWFGWVRGGSFGDGVNNRSGWCHSARLFGHFWVHWHEGWGFSTRDKGIQVKRYPFKRLRNVMFDWKIFSYETEIPFLRKYPI